MSRNWNDPETDTLREFVSQGLNHSEIGRLMGRTRSSIRARVRHMDMERANPLAVSYTPRGDDAAFLTRLHVHHG